MGLARRRLETTEQTMLIGTQLYAVHEQTGRARFLPEHRSVAAMLEYNTFMRRLPGAHVHELVTLLQRRSYERRDLLRGSNSSMVHIVLSGCVVEETSYGDTTTVRILGAGAVLGDMEICDDTLIAPTTRCLSRTLTLAITMDRMRMIARHNTVVALAIASSVVDRVKDTERVYGRPGLRPEERLAGLFVHLLRTCAVPCRKFGRMLAGPTQADLAEALCVSAATLDQALRTLRDENLVVTGYRTFQFPSESALAERGRVRISSPWVTGESSQG
ncbi:Crp/Fnr family transcriptional regulator [Streptomyces sp. NBC_00091]|uniref:Crp/Fnr family transcriptional regulator n=1 Tax=Streptomyces sp. NBC_00091 TaxID=2975648 RepID=UPI0022524CDA|nr:Crp/Fnr family transcriptional regulator [Streptomyces sp. NBC_00091]MCX5376847.1 Crp/Fnr family transcriptional regulator [Streptomyces sp. NBC_00091]